MAEQKLPFQIIIQKPKLKTKTATQIQTQIQNESQPQNPIKEQVVPALKPKLKARPKSILKQDDESSTFSTTSTASSVSSLSTSTSSQQDCLYIPGQAPDVMPRTYRRMIFGELFLITTENTHIFDPTNNHLVGKVLDGGANIEWFALSCP